MPLRRKEMQKAKQQATKAMGQAAKSAPGSRRGAAGRGAAAGERAAGVRKMAEQKKQQMKKQAPSRPSTMPETAKAINTRKAQVQKIGKAAGAKAQKIGRAGVKVADRAIANKINDPLGTKRASKAMKAAKDTYKKTGRPTSRNPRNK
jgi:hypothetical protein